MNFTISKANIGAGKRGVGNLGTLMAGLPKGYICWRALGRVRETGGKKTATRTTIIESSHGFNDILFLFVAVAVIAGRVLSKH